MDFIENYLDGLCRTCLIEVNSSSYGNNTRPQWQSILDKIEECDTLRIAELLSTVVPQIQIQPSDELPKKICRECLQQLLGAYRFQQMCVQSEEQLRELVSTKHTEFKMSIMEAFKEHELETNDTDSIALETAHSSSSHQNLEHAAIQKPLYEIPDQMAEHETVQYSLENKVMEACNNEEGRFKELIKNEPIEEDDTMHSTNSIECKKEETNRDETIEPKEEQSSAADQLESIDQLPEHCKDSQGGFKCEEEMNVCKDEIIEPGTTQSSAANQLEGINQLPNFELIKNEPIEDDEPSIEYSDGDIIHSSISVTKEEVLAIELEEEQVNMKLSQHKCKLCNKSFRKLQYLERHQELHKSKGDKFQKDVKRSRHSHKGKSSQGLSSYRIRHGENKPYECPYCPLKFRNRSYVRKHKEVHEGVKRVACDICGKQIRKKYLKQHKLVHSGEKPHKCDFCEERFISIERLRIHSRKHTGEKPFKCKYCECAFAIYDTLKNHLRTHLGDNVFRCEFCPSAFPLASERRLHLVSHKNEDPETRERNIKALEEDEAKLRLQSTEELEQQLKYRIRHGESKPYECPYCPLKFRTSRQVTQHKELHEGVKRVACDICGKKMRKMDLKKHKQIHSKEKLHKCDICEMRFINTQRLRVHSRTHTGERPYKCQYCECAYTTSAAVMKHLRNHLGNNVFRCQFCPSAFPLASERRLHLLSHKNEDPETRGRNIKALEEVEAKLRLQISTEESLHISKEKTQKLLTKKSLHFPKMKTQQLSTEESLHIPKEKTQKLPTEKSLHIPKEKTQQLSTKESEQQLKDGIRRGEKEPYECPHCPMRFHSIFHMKRHKQVHEAEMRGAVLNKHKLLIRSEENPHKCDFCERRFNIKTPFKCKYCECAYSTLAALMVHLRIHLGDNVYRCESCPLAFASAPERRLHFATHKNEDPETRERNIKALEEHEAKLRLHISNEKTQQPSTEESEQQLKLKAIE